MLLGYKPRFRSPIDLGTKLHTLRKERKIAPKIGETLFMYTGVRTKACKLITNKHTLKSVQPCHIIINYSKTKAGETFVGSYGVSVEGKGLDVEILNEFVINDGFEDLNDFLSYWIDSYHTGKPGSYKIDEDMVCLHWTDLKY